MGQINPEEVNVWYVTYCHRCRETTDFKKVDEEGEFNVCQCKKCEYKVLIRKTNQSKKKPQKVW
jgi:hypothetical protein